MKQFKELTNYFLSEFYVNNFKKQFFIQTIALHKIFPSRKDINPINGIPLESIDLIQFEYFISYFTKRKIKFIDENDILNGLLNPLEKYIYLTFDDGYYNSFLVLDILKKYNAKATFFISTNHIEEQKSFWWDVQYRERMFQGKDTLYIKQEINELYKMLWYEQEEYIIKTFGKNKLIPLSKLDRPITKEELQMFSQHHSVCIGNHTHNHLNTTHYRKKELIESINIAHQFLEESIQKPIQSIAYPYGHYNEDVIETMNELTYRIGLTVDFGRNNLEQITIPNQALKIKRISIDGKFDIQNQLHNIAYGFSFLNKINKTLYNKTRR